MISKIKNAISRNIVWLKALVKRKVKNKFALISLKLLVHIPGIFFLLCSGDVAGAKKRKEDFITDFRNTILTNSIFIFESEMFMASCFPKKELDKTLSLFKPKTILDIGCGVGKSLDYFYSKGVDVLGIEGSSLAISKANNPKRILLRNLNKELNLGRKFDLIWSFEFVEHIHPKFINNLMRTFSNHSDRVVLSAAQPEQAGSGHLNKQPESYWITQFEKSGYTLNAGVTNELRNINEVHSKNMYFFERQKQ
ncbi:MAG: methyltransferase domain-containing protein [Candidatus Omnitrophica bacterium]|nr:methyltransferase domain-containing protein [Candidatus Omnitrophota bacterium]